MRRAWNRHSAQKQIFEEGSEAFDSLSKLKETLQTAVSEPHLSTGGGDAPAPLSRRKQLVQIRNELRSTLATVDAKIEQVTNAPEEEDVTYERARNAAKERMKLPLHLRGSAVLAEMIPTPDPCL